MKYNKKCNLFKFKKPILVLYNWVPFGKNYLSNLINRINIGANNINKYFANLSKMEIDNNGLFYTKPNYTKLNVKEIYDDKKINLIIESYNKNKYILNINYLGVIKTKFCIKQINNMKVFYGFDEISKVIPNISKDVNQLLDPILLSTQKELLNAIYDKKQNKNIAVLILINEKITDIDHRIQCELREVIGNIKKIFTKKGVNIIIGEYGVIVFNYRNMDTKMWKALDYYQSLKIISNVISDIFLSLCDISKELNELSKVIKKEIKKEAQIKEFRIKLSQMERKISFIEICLGFIKDSLENIKEEYSDLKDCEISDKIKNKFNKINEKLEEIDTTLKSNLEYAENLTRLIYTFSEDTQFKLVKELSKNMIHQIAIGEGMEILEATIFGIYFLEVVHILTQLSGYEKFFKYTYFLGFNLEFWVLLLTAVLGIGIGYSLIKWRKERILKKLKELD